MTYTYKFHPMGISAIRVSVSLASYSTQIRLVLRQHSLFDQLFVKDLKDVLLNIKSESA